MKSISTPNGWNSDDGGFTAIGRMCFWPSHNKWGKWVCIADFWESCEAVIDDFGNLVRVPA